MPLPNPLTFPIRISSIVSSGPDSSNKYRFTYKAERQNPPNGNSATIAIEVIADNADDYPTGQNLTFSLTTIP